MDIKYRDKKVISGKMDELEVSYDQLVALFGEPNAGPSPDGKVTVQWNLYVNGIAVEVWDWKGGPNWSVWAEDRTVIDELDYFFASQDYSEEGWEASGGWEDPNEPMSEEEDSYIDPKSDPMYTFPAKSETPDMSNAKMDGDRPACEGVENHMLETVQEEIGYINEDAGGHYFYAVVRRLGSYIVRQLKADGQLIEQTLKEFYDEITDDEDES